MRIKTKNKNRFILSSSNIWVRDFTKPGYQDYTDINQLIGKHEFGYILENERANAQLPIEKIDEVPFRHDQCVIISDGYSFEEKQQLLHKLPESITFLGVNGSLAKWNVGQERGMHYFVVNNPYKEALLQIPSHGYFPRCIMSIRTYPGFASRYQGYIYKYTPHNQEDYLGLKTECAYKVDDYRNPICAAINLAFHLEARKILLFCCDDSFKNERPGAEQLENGLWTYPQHRVMHDIVDAQIYWLTHQEDTNVVVKDHSSGPKYKNAQYISEEEISNFFEV